MHSGTRFHRLYINVNNSGGSGGDAGSWQQSHSQFCPLVEVPPSVVRPRLQEHKAENGSSFNQSFRKNMHEIQALKLFKMIKNQQYKKNWRSTKHCFAWQRAKSWVINGLKSVASGEQSPSLTQPHETAVRRACVHALLLSEWQGSVIKEFVDPASRSFTSPHAATSSRPRPHLSHQCAVRLRV